LRIVEKYKTKVEEMEKVVEPDLIGFSVTRWRRVKKE